MCLPTAWRLSRHAAKMIRGRRKSSESIPTNKTAAFRDRPFFFSRKERFVNVEYSSSPDHTMAGQRNCRSEIFAVSIDLHADAQSARRRADESGRGQRQLVP